MNAKGRSPDDIAEALDRDCRTIRDFLVKMHDTGVLAQATLKAGSSKLAERIIAKSDVKEAIEVLSRPNIGVLAPAAKSNGSGVFELSVGVSSCGTVVHARVGGSGEEATAQLPSGERSSNSGLHQEIPSGQQLLQRSDRQTTSS